MGKTIQLKNHALNTLLYPITKAENVKFDDSSNLNDKLEELSKATQIDDSRTESTVTWSSAKINEEITKKANAQSTSFNNSSNGMIATNVQEAIEEVFQDVSNGKKIIATAITDKGITTSSNDDFQTIADNINQIKTGVDVSINNKAINFDFDLELFDIDRKFILELPRVEIFFSSLAYHNKEVHLFELGLHYKYTENTGWEEIIDGVGFSYCDAISINNELHVLARWVDGIDDACPINVHCKYDGNEWQFVSELPTLYTKGALAEFNGELHFVSHVGFISSNEDSMHYRYDGNEWHLVHKFPFKLSYAKTLTINEEIHLLGCKENGEIAHCKYNGDEWECLPIPIEQKGNELLVNAFELMGEIYAVLLNEDCVTTVYKCENENWTKAFDLGFSTEFLLSVTTEKDLCILNYSADGENIHCNYTPLYKAKKK